MEISFSLLSSDFTLTLKGETSHKVTLGTEPRGNLIRMDNALANISERMERAKERLENLETQQEAARAELGKPFPQEAELAEKSARLAELDAELNMDGGSDAPDREDAAEQAGTEGRPSVLDDLKKCSAEITPDKTSGREPERG